MINLIKSVWKKLKSLLTIKPKCISTNTTKELRKLNHSCALTALSRVMPSLSYDEISNAFYNCCVEWPRAGVKHNEFNIVLRYLKKFDNFTYFDNSQKHLTLAYYLKKNGIYILLIPGHYTVLCDGKIDDSYGYGNNLSKNTKVYCSWLMSSGK